MEPEFLFEIIIVFLTELRKRIFQRFLKEKATRDDRKFVEYLLVELSGGSMGASSLGLLPLYQDMVKCITS